MTHREQLVTVAIPLYRSARFIDNIAANIDALTCENREVLISDRHGLDDALDQLERRYRDDSRVRILRATDGIDWVAHYNELLKAASGTYFCCMPHDDSFPPGYVSRLVAALEARPDAIVACGTTWVGEDGATSASPVFVPAPLGADERPSVDVALRLLLFWDLHSVIHGVFRRDLLMRHRLFLPRTRDGVFADICWAFAMTLYGRVESVPDAACLKRREPSSASIGWRYGIRQGINEYRVMCTVLWTSPHPRLRVIRGIGILTYVAIARLVWRALRLALGKPKARGPNTARVWLVGALWRWLAPRGAGDVAPRPHVGRIR